MKRKIFVTAVLVCLVFLGLVGCKTDPNAVATLNSNSQDATNVVLENVIVEFVNCDIYEPFDKKTGTQWTWNFIINLPEGYWGFGFKIDPEECDEEFDLGLLNETRQVVVPLRFNAVSGKKKVFVWCYKKRTRDNGVQKIMPVKVWEGKIDLNKKEVDVVFTLLH